MSSVDTKKNVQAFLSSHEKLRIKICLFSRRKYWQFQRSRLTKGKKEQACTLCTSTSGNFTSKFQASLYQKLSVSKSFLILPERGQSSLLDLFIKKLKKTCLVYLAGNICLASGKKDRLDWSWEPWQPLLLSSSFLVQGWSADSQTATHRAPNQLISFLPLDFFQSS